MALAVSAWLMPAAPAGAQEIDEAKALKVKAAYLYNFAKFIEWPDDGIEDETTPFVMGVLGDDPFGRILEDTVKAKKIAKRPVKTRRLHWGEQVDRRKLQGCHVLYVGRSQRFRLKDIFATLKDQPVLLAADIPGFASDGGMIGFVLAEKRIIFEINREALEQAGLKASARLLKLAKIVKPKGSRSGGVKGSRG